MADLSVIVLAFANEQDGHRYLRKLPEELRALERVFPPGESTGHLTPVFLSNASPESLLKTLDRLGRRVVAFHYGGHAGPDGLLLEESGPQGALAHAPG